MKQPLQIVFRGMEPSAAVESAARERLTKLERFAPNLTSCRIVVELETKHQQQGNPFSVRIDLTLPGHELSVDRVRNEDAHVALREAFDTMTRRLEDTVRRTRGV
jgi:ribosomal subunit interface protein